MKQVFEVTNLKLKLSLQHPRSFLVATTVSSREGSKLKAYSSYIMNPFLNLKSSFESWGRFDLGYLQDNSERITSPPPLMLLGRCLPPPKENF
jgi:hypothetical protein